MKQCFLLVVISLSTIIAEARTLKEGQDHHLSRNHIALVAGATTNFDHHSTDFTIGLDYEYRFKAMHDFFGLGLFGEYITTHGGEIVLGIPVFIHPKAGLKFVMAPIAVMAENHYTHENETHFGGRLGIGYDFHLGKISIAPVLNLDYSNTVALNYGLTFGLGF